MTIKNNVENAVSGLRNMFTNGIANIGQTIKSKFDTAVAKIGSIYDGGFIGVDEHNWDNIKTSVNALIEAAQTELAAFAQDGEVGKLVDGAIKGGANGEGGANEALKAYLESAKALLNAYVQTYQNFIAAGNEAYNAMFAGDRQNAQNIQAASTDLQQQAQSLIDELKDEGTRVTQ